MRRTRDESAIDVLDNPPGSADSGAGRDQPGAPLEVARTTKSKRSAIALMNSQNPNAERGPADQSLTDAHAGVVSGAKPKRRGQRAKKTHSLPAASGEEGHGSGAIPAPAADLATLCAHLKTLQVRRKHYIRSKDRNRLALGAMVRSELGWRADLPEKERAAIRKKAADYIDKALAGKVIEGMAWLVLDAGIIEKSCAPFDEALARTEKKMLGFAKQLPVAEWIKAKERNGFGMPTLAVIIGETGDIGNYENPGKIWKRLGLAPKDTYPQADNGAYMVPRQRRAQIWASLGDSLLKAQTRKIKDADGEDTGERIALGEYGEAYLRKKAEYLERGWTKNHAHRAAHRYMEKRAIRDLWRAWRGQSTTDARERGAPPPLLDAAE